MDLRGMSYASGDLCAGGSHPRHVLGRQAASVEHRAVFAVRFHQLFATADVFHTQLHTTDEPLKGLCERLAVEATDARTLWVSVDEHGQRRKEWKQVCREIQFHSFDDRGTELHSRYVPELGSKCVGPHDFCFFVLETIRTGAMRVVHITVNTEVTQILRIKFALVLSYLCLPTQASLPFQLTADRCS